MSSIPAIDLAAAGRAAGRVDLAELIDRRPMSAAQMWVAALCAAALFVDGYDIQVMALAVPSLSQAWSLPPSSFGFALSAVVIGITAGSGLLGPLGDRFGRRTMLVITMACVGLLTCATALATSPGEFTFWRLATGIALGAGIPSCAALTSEYAPVASRSFVMGLMNVATPIGAFSAGFLAPVILEAFGWRGTFVIGGIGPLIIAALALLVPESLKFLLVRRPTDVRISKYLRRIAPDIDPDSMSVHASTGAQRVSPLELLSVAFRSRTLLLWGLLVLNLFNLYLLVSWLPTLLEKSGWNLADALRGAVLIQGGGIAGGLLMSRFMDRGATRPALVGGFLLSAAGLIAFTFLPGHSAWIVLLLFVGAGVSGAQLSLNALSAAYYPPAIKATGVAWALVIGGIGSVAGPMAGAALIDRGLTPATILALLAIPPVVCALSVVLMRREWQAH
jgi:AAHS family 4-hydroxybenzoate transporter-like MFS transporter